jgi:hypothetical protein
MKRINKIIVFGLLAACFTSCVTQNKVNNWLGKHPDKAAEYCADRFPPDTLTKTVIEQTDSAGYYDAYMGMSYLADSLMNELQRKSNAATPDKPYKPNVDSIRAVIDKEIRKRLKPCVDTVKVVTTTIVDMARVKQLQGLIDKKDFVIAEMQVRVEEQQDKIRGQRKWFWLFWALVVAAGLYAFVKLRYKLPI